MKRITLAADDPQVLADAANILSSLGYEVHIAPADTDKSTLTHRAGQLEARLQARESELGDLKKQMDDLPLIDATTGLPNRRHFLDMLEREISLAQRYDYPLACLLFQIDQYASIAGLSEATCLAFLTELSSLAKRILRKSDFLARFANDSFAVLLPQTERTGADAVAHKIRTTVAGYLFDGLDPSIEVTVSVGVAEFPHVAVYDSGDLMKVCEYALQRSREDIGGATAVDFFRED